MTLGPVPDATDTLGNKISEGDPVVYGAGDGYVHFGVVRAINSKVVELWDYQASAKVESWALTLKVEKQKSGTDRYPGARHASLKRLSNVVVLDGAVGAKVKNDIEDSWVDTGL